MGLSQYGELGELGNLGGILDVFRNIRNGVVAIATRIKARAEERKALAEGKTPEQARAEATAAAMATGKEAAAEYAKRVAAGIAAEAPGISPTKLAMIAAGVAVAGGAVYYLTKK